MAFNIKAYYEDSKDYYGNVPLEEVARDVYERGFKDKHPDYNTWKQSAGIDSALEEDRRLRNPTFEDKLRSAVEKPKGDGNIVKSFLQGGAEGLTTELPSMIGGALQFTGSHLPFKGIEKAGKSLKDWAEEKRQELYGPEIERTGLDRIVYEGTKMLAPSLIPGGVAGTIARGAKGVNALLKAGKVAEATAAAKSATNIAGGSVAALFGLSQAQQTKDTAEQEGVDPGLAPYVTGAIEAAGEFLGTKYLAKLFRLDEAEIVQRGTKEFVKDLIKTIGVETGTEIGQASGEAAVEKYSGIRPNANPIMEAIDVIGPTAFMTILTGGLAGAANKLRSQDPEEKAAAQYIEKLKAGAMFSMAINEGLSTGEYEGNPFTSDHAIEVIKEAQNKGVFDDTDIDRFKDKYPQLRDGLNGVIAENVINKVSEAVKQIPWQDFTLKGAPYQEGVTVGQPYGGEILRPVKPKSPESAIDASFETISRIEAPKREETKLLPGQGFELLETNQDEITTLQERIQKVQNFLDKNEKYKGGKKYQQIADRLEEDKAKLTELTGGEDNGTLRETETEVENVAPTSPEAGTTDETVDESIIPFGANKDTFLKKKTNLNATPEEAAKFDKDNYQTWEYSKSGGSNIDGLVQVAQASSLRGELDDMGAKSIKNKLYDNRRNDNAQDIFDKAQEYGEPISMEEANVIAKQSLEHNNKIDAAAKLIDVALANNKLPAPLSQTDAATVGSTDEAKSGESLNNQALIEEARKYKSAEEFVQKTHARFFANADKLTPQEKELSDAFYKSDKEAVWNKAQDGKGTDTFGNIPKIQKEQWGNYPDKQLKEFADKGVKGAQIEIAKRQKKAEPEPKEIFIRSAEKRDLARVKKSLKDIPDKFGYEKVYKRNGSQGRGFYYDKVKVKEVQPEKPEPKPSGAENLVTFLTRAGKVRLGEEFQDKTGDAWSRAHGFRAKDRSREAGDVAVVTSKNGKMAMDEAASFVNAEGYRDKNGDKFTDRTLFETLSNGEGRNILHPDHAERIINKRIEDQAYENAREQEEEYLDQQREALAQEGIDATREIEENSESVRADLISEIEAEGNLTEEQLEAAHDEISSFFDEMSKEPRTENTKAGKQVTIPGASEAETFSLTANEPATPVVKGAKLTPKNLQPKEKAADMFAEGEAPTATILKGTYTSEGDTEKDMRENGSNTPERKFKADLKQYAKKLQEILGYEPDITTKGKKSTDTTVSTNIAPIGGDGHIILWKPNSEYGIYISVSADLDAWNDSIGDYGHDKLTINPHMMYRATTRKDKHSGMRNQSISGNISAEDLARKIKAEVDFYDQVKGAAEIIQEAKDEHFSETAITKVFTEGEAIGEAEGADKSAEEIQAKIDEVAAELGVEVKLAEFSSGDKVRDISNGAEYEIIVADKRKNGKGYSLKNIKSGEKVHFDDIETPQFVKIEEKPFLQETGVSMQGGKLVLDHGEVKKPYGSKNKLVSEEEADKAREILRKALAGINMGAPLSPEVVHAGMKLATYHIEAGARTFIDYANKMIADLGDVVRPYLKQFYVNALYQPGMDTDGMNTPAEMDKIDVNAIGKEKKSPFQYGQEAFARGAKAIPAQDKDFLDTLAGKNGVEKDLDEWLRGWHESNLAAPISSPKAKAAAPVKQSADLSAYGLTVTKSKTNNGKDVWNVSGKETRTWKDTIKKVGGRWYGPRKVWSFYNSDPTNDLLAALPPIGEVHQSIRQDETTSSPYGVVAERVADKLNKQEKFTRNELFFMCKDAFGGTLAEGKFTAKDAYDALEMGINKYLENSPLEIPAENEQAVHVIENLKSMFDLIPTQTTRTEEMDEWQQFSTPPALAFAANWVANLNGNDVYLEPSAGTGNIAVFAKIADVKETIVNELAPRRAAILKELGFDQVFKENAEQINNILPREIKPTVVVMNPPFSSTAGRMQGQRKTSNATAHIEQCLKRLQPGGRLVAIVGDGMGYNAPAFKSWWSTIEKDYIVSANVGISGQEYKKYGTTFDNRIIVIDKPINLANLSENDYNIVTGRVNKIEDLINLLEGVRNERINPAEQPQTESGKQASAVSAQADTGRGGSVLPATGGVVTQEQSGRSGRQADGNGGANAAVAQSAKSNAVDNTTGQRGGSRSGSVGTGKERSEGTGRPDSVSDTRQVDESVDSISPEESTSLTVEQKAEVEKHSDELTDSIFDAYKPAKLSIPHAKEHPGRLVESAAMASIEPIDPTYSPKLPDKIVKEGKVSIAQLEAVVYAGQAHSEVLPNGNRKGFFIGDGTGVGKGREISAIFWDNWNHGRKKGVWVSLNSPLIKDAQRDIKGIGWDSDLLFDVGKVKLKDPIKAKTGIGFISYGTLRYKKVENGRTDSRLQQLVDWLGADYDGVIAFDESHNMGNAIAVRGKRGMTKPSSTALTGIELQRLLPNARVLYVSATGATEVMNLAYADRLGLWGDQTPFANSTQFVQDISAGGITSMEMVAMNMKANGVYMARSLSYDDVKYDKLEHPLTDDQRKIYDELAGAWQVTLQNINEALVRTGVVDEHTGETKNPAAKSHLMSQYWGSNQRFWNQIITSMQMPSAIKAMEKDIKDGHAVLVQLVNTNEAAQERAIADLEEEDSLEDLDITPKEMLINYVDNAFPIYQYEDYLDDQGNVQSRLVVDSAGNFVINQEALRLKEDLLIRLASIRVPDGPMELILDHFGVDVVAEVTGRSRRVVYKNTKDGKHRVTETWGKNKGMADADAFMNDKKQILIFSKAGGTGRSYHADNEAKNKRLRKHYLIQAGWRADVAVQGLGRSHRSNQKQAPEWILVTTDLKGQRRFISSIARRLNQLGALTRGQREAGSQGLFNSRDNLESQEARDALRQLIVDIHHDEVPGLSMNRFMDITGLNRMIDPQTGALNDSNLPNITQFLNRILNMQIDIQNTVFDEFSSRLDMKVAQAIENGTLDTGVETIRAKRTEKINEQVVYTDNKTKANAKYVEVELTHDAKLIDFEKSQSMNKYGYVKNIRSGRVWVLAGQKSMTTRDGNVVPVYVSIGTNYTYHNIPVDDVNNAEKYEKLNNDDAKLQWDAEYVNIPKEVKERVHLVTGTILPIWDRLPQENARVYRLNVDGKNIIGRVIESNDLADTLINLGAAQSQVNYAPENVFNNILHLGYRYRLSNRWRLMRSKVAGDNRIEIKGPDYYQLDELKKYGVFTERISYEARHFIPTNPEEGINAIREITVSRPVAEEVIPHGARATDITTQDVNFRRGSDQYSLRTPGPYSMPTLKDVQDVFKGQEVKQFPNGAFLIRTKNGAEVIISAVDKITPSKISLSIGYSKTGISENEAIAGRYDKGMIDLVKGQADKWTLTHESVHFMEDIGVINNQEVKLLKNHIKNLVSEGQWNTLNKNDIGGAEDRAEFLAQALQKEPRGLLGRIINKIQDFIDMLANAFGVRTVRGITRDIKTGEIYGHETGAQREARLDLEGGKLTEMSESGNQYSMTTKKGTAKDIPAKESLNAGGGLYKARGLQEAIIIRQEQASLATYDLQSQREYLRGKNPPKDGNITIYRATPDGADIKAGDYVTNDLQYAKDHIKNNLGNDGKITSIKASLDDIFPADGPGEFWYAPKSIESAKTTPQAEAGLVKDEHNNPVKVYHGTIQDYIDFDANKLGYQTKAKSAEKAWFFSDSPETAKHYNYINPYNLIPKRFITEDPFLGLQIKKNIPEKYQQVVDAFNSKMNEYLSPYQREIGRRGSPPKGLVDFTKTYPAVNRDYLLEFIKKNDPDIYEDAIKIKKEVTGHIVETAYEWGNLLGRKIPYRGENFYGFIDLATTYVGETLSYNSNKYAATALGYKPQIKEANVIMQNPYIVDFDGSAPSKKTKSLDIDYILKQAKKKGHDGVIFKNIADGGPISNHYAVFDKSQIKILPNPSRPPEVGGNKEQYQIRKQTDPPVSRDPKVLNLYLKDETDAIVQTIMNKLRPKSMTWLETMLKSPEWFDHPQIQNIVKLFMRDRNEIYHETFNELNLADDINSPENTVTEAAKALKNKGLTLSERLSGKVSPEYQTLMDMIDDGDTRWKRNKNIPLESQLKNFEDIWRKKGATDEIVNVWKLFRKSYDKALDLMTAQLRRMMDEITEEARLKGEKPDLRELKQTLKGALAEMEEWRGFYAPRLREPGNWAVQAYKEHGPMKENREWYRTHKGSELAAQREAKKLEREGWTIHKIGELDRIPETIYQDVNAVATAKLIDEAIDKMAKKSKLTEDKVIKFNEEILRTVSDAIKARGFRSTMIHRRGGNVVRGFVEDPMQRHLMYINNVSGGISKARVARMSMKELLGDKVMGEQYGGIDPVKEPKAFATAQDYIQEQLRNSEPIDRIIGLAKSIATFKFLGFNLRSLAVNTTAILTTAPAAIHQYVTGGKGSMTEIFRELAKAGKDYGLVMSGKDLGNPDEAAFIADVHKKGWDDAQYTREALGEIAKTHSKVWSTMMDASMYLFGKSEQWNRGTTMLAAYRMARKQGLNHADAAERAKTSSDRAHGVYGKSTMPMWAQGTNPAAKIGQMMYVYSKFGHNYLQMLYDMGLKQKNIKGAMFAFLSPLVLAGGAALPFKDAIFGFAGAILSLLGFDDDPEKWVWDQIRDHLGGGAEKVGRHGLTGAMGVDISGSLSIGVGIPKNFIDLTGAIGGVATEIKEAGENLGRGQYSKAAEHILPTGFANPLRAIRESEEGVTTRNNRRVWNEKGRPYVPDTGATVARAFGFRSSDQAVLSERTWEGHRQQSQFAEKRNSIYERYRAWILGGRDREEYKEIVKDVQEFNAYIRRNRIRGESFITSQSLRNQVRRMQRPSKKERSILEE
jgi:hypothetical protein